MKKIHLIFVFVLVMVFSALTGCTSTDEVEAEPVATEKAETVEATEAPAETYVIGVIWNGMNEITEARMDYLENEVGAALGIEFIFSEEITSVDASMTFIENAYAAGAQAILSTMTDGQEQQAAKCNELGMYLAIVSSTFPTEVEDLEYFMGICGIELTKVGDAYGELITNKLDAGEEHSFLIVSGGAPMGVASHREATVAMLNKIQEIYGLTYESDAMTLATTFSQTDVVTGSNVKITLYPGFPNMDGYIAGISGLLQSGEYDVLLSVYPSTTVFATAIDEVEKALGQNIIVLSNMTFGEVAKTAFETLDSTGNSSVEGTVINPSLSGDAIGIIMLYNGLTGNADVIKPDGKAVILGGLPLVILDAEEYSSLSLLDTSPETYMFKAEDLEQLCAVFNPSVTLDDIVKAINDCTTDNLISSLEGSN